MSLRTKNKTTGVGRLIAPLLLAITVCLGGMPCTLATTAYADETAETDTDAAAQDTAGLEDNLRAKTIEERIRMYTAQQSDRREVDFLSICCDSGEIDVDMTITYANEEPSKAYSPDYLYVRLDVDGEEGFKWLSPVVDPENGNTLSYSFFLSEGRRAAFWIFDYPQERTNETPPTLSLKATDRKGRQVFGTVVGSFRSDFEDSGDGSFYLSNARVNEDAEDKAGLPNAKIVLSVPPDPEPEQESTPDESGDEEMPTTPEDDGDNGDGRKINWDDDGKVPQLGDAVVALSFISITLSIIAICIVNSKKK